MGNQIFVQAFTQFENTGDLIINKSLIELLRPHGRIVLNDKNVPEWYLSHLGIANTERLSFITKKGFIGFLIFESLKSRLSSDKGVYLFSGPGHMYGTSIKRGLKTLLASLLFAFLKVLSCRILKIGASLGPLSNFLLFTESVRSRFMTAYFLRDSLSLDLAKQGGFRNVHFFPDLAWSLQVKKSNLEVKKTDIFLSFRGSSHGLSKKSDYFDRLIASLDILLSKLCYNEEFRIVLGYQVDCDFELCLMIKEQLKKQYSITIINEKIQVDNALDVYRTVKYVISNRLHVLLFANKYGALPLALIDIEEHLKIVGIFRDADLEGLIIDIYDSNLNLLSDFEERTRLFLKKISDAESKYYKESKSLVSSVFKE